MIDLTPLDVRKKKEDFRKAVRGYDPDQVGSFLDLVADRMEELVREQRSLTERVESLRERLSSYQEREKALNEALLAAQELREEARSQAERDAAVRMREAESHAEAILLEADQAIRHSQRRLDDIRARRSQLLRALRGVSERLMEFLEVEEAKVDAEPDELADLLEKLDTDLSGSRHSEPEERRRPPGPEPSEPVETAGRRTEPSSGSADGSRETAAERAAAERAAAEPSAAERGGAERGVAAGEGREEEA